MRLSMVEIQMIQYTDPLNYIKDYGFNIRVILSI